MNMKRCLILIIALFVLSNSCTLTEASDSFNTQHTAIKLTNSDDLYSFLTFHEKRYPLVSAHRGGAAEGYPENAIETFEYNFRRQPLIIECDIALSKDSVLILMHDDKLDRTTTGTGLVQDLTLSELKQLYLKDNFGQRTNFRIPTLAEALKWGRGKVLFTLDIKANVPYEQVIETVKKFHAEPYAVIITYNANQAALVYKHAPDLMISATIKEVDDLVRLNDFGVPDNRLIAFVGISEPDQALYERLHDHGILCILGTMGNIDKKAETKGETLYYKLIERGADILATDRHSEAGLQLHRFIQNNDLVSSYIRN